MIKCRDWKTATDYLKQAKKFKKYDFKKSLNFKLNAVIEYSSRE